MSRAHPPHRALLRWLLRAHWRERPAGVAVASLSIAIGIALALGVHLVNRSALAEFASAIALVNGDAQAQIVGRSGSIDERLFASIARAPGIAAASPVIESRAIASAGTNQIALRLIGIDPMRAAAVTPSLLPSVDPELNTDPAAFFSDDAVFLSRSAARELQISAGQSIIVQAGEHRVRLRFAGTLDGVAGDQSIAVIDIGNAQHWFGQGPLLTRIDLRLDERMDAAAVRAAIEPLLPAQVIWSASSAASQRMSNLSRAYRVNLNVLALVALFTGAFIVQATLALRVARQQQEIALLGVLGAPRRFASARVLADAIAIGTLGAIAGVIGGIALASALLRLTGGDLGGGYFERGAPGIAIDAQSLVLALVGGLGVALAGALSPMRAARAIAPARAVRSGSTETVLASRQRPLRPLLLMLVAASLLAAPPIADLPLAAYAAIAMLLLAGVMLTAALIGPLARALTRRLEAHHPAVTLWLAASRIAGAPGSAASALGGVVASFALASAMAIMVTSFRVSVSDWLDQVLPADVYARLPVAASGAGFGEPLQTSMKTLEGVRQVEFMRLVPMLFAEHRPSVMLVARPLHRAGAAARLPLTGETRGVPDGSIGVWVSEAFADIYRVRPGDRITLPIGSNQPPLRAFVAGIWRDYARQHGAVAIDLDDYRSLTGDTSANEVAWWLDDRAAVSALIERARALSSLTETMEYRETAELKALSLRIFDRSFAITHALEAIAIAVALFGVASAVAGEALSRLREFGMLRHLGVSRRQVGRQFAIEAAIGTTIACLWGLVLGAAVAWILVHRVNPHSFHWTMSMHWPVGVLAASGLAMLALATLAARLAAREATGKAPVLAVREDW